MKPPARWTYRTIKLITTVTKVSQAPTQTRRKPTPAVPRAVLVGNQRPIPKAVMPKIELRKAEPKAKFINCSPFLTLRPRRTTAQRSNKKARTVMALAPRIL